MIFVEEFQNKQQARAASKAAKTLYVMYGKTFWNACVKLREKQLRDLHMQRLGDSPSVPVASSIEYRDAAQAGEVMDSMSRIMSEAAVYGKTQKQIEKMTGNQTFPHWDLNDQIFDEAYVGSENMDEMLAGRKLYWAIKHEQRAKAGA